MHNVNGDVGGMNLYISRVAASAAVAALAVGSRAAFNAVPKDWQNHFNNFTTNILNSICQQLRIGYIPESEPAPSPTPAPNQGSDIAPKSAHEPTDTPEMHLETFYTILNDIMANQANFPHHNPVLRLVNRLYIRGYIDSHLKSVIEHCFIENKALKIPITIAMMHESDRSAKMQVHFSRADNTSALANRIILGINQHLRELPGSVVLGALIHECIHIAHNLDGSNDFHDVPRHGESLKGVSRHVYHSWVYIIADLLVAQTQLNHGLDPKYIYSHEDNSDWPTLITQVISNSAAGNTMPRDRLLGGFFPFFTRPWHLIDQDMVKINRLLTDDKMANLDQNLKDFFDFTNIFYNRVSAFFPAIKAVDLTESEKETYHNIKMSLSKLVADFLLGNPINTGQLQLQ